MARVEYKVLKFKVSRWPIIEGMKTERTQVGTQEQVERGLFGGEKRVQVPLYEERQVPNLTGYSDYRSDVDKLVEALNTDLNSYAEEGWRVVSVETVLRGDYNIKPSAGGIETSWGFSMTDFFVVILERHV